MLHGPYRPGTRTIAGKTVTRTLTPDQGRRYEPWFANARRLRAVSVQLDKLSLQIATPKDGSRITAEKR